MRKMWYHLFSMILHLFRAGGAYGHYGTEDHEDRARTLRAEGVGPGEFDVL